MLRRLLITIIVLTGVCFSSGPEGSVPANLRFAPSLTTLWLGPSQLRAFSSFPPRRSAKKCTFFALTGSVGSRGHGRPRFAGILPSGPAQIPPSGQIKGEIIDTTSNDFAVFGLTDAGEIFWSRDGKSWEVIDFNEAYRGYYQPVRFVGIAAGNGSVAVVGTYEKTGAPAMFVSSRGNVWTERGLTYSQGEELFELTEAPLAVRADLERDEFVITCTDGVLFFVPPCSHCNRKEYHGD